MLQIVEITFRILKPAIFYQNILLPKYLRPIFHNLKVFFKFLPVCFQLYISLCSTKNLFRFSSYIKGCISPRYKITFLVYFYHVTVNVYLKKYLLKKFLTLKRIKNKFKLFTHESKLNLLIRAFLRLNLLK